MSDVERSSLDTTLRRVPGVWPVVRTVGRKYLTMKARRTWQELAQRPSHEIKLDLGSGPKRGVDGWTTVDQARESDIPWDLRNGVPLPDNSASLIYCSHLLEHLPFAAMIDLLRECYRVLESGGVLSVAVPNARLYLLAYLRQEVFERGKPQYTPAVCDTGSLMDQVNYIAYMGGEHHYMFDDASLLAVLQQAGFENVVLREFDEWLDLPERHSESIYATARKTA